MGEVLLCPRRLGLLDMNGPALSTLRAAFGGTVFGGPSCVTYHPFGAPDLGHCVIQNFNEEAVAATLTLPTEAAAPSQFVEVFSGRAVPARPAEPRNHTTLDLRIPARGRVWIRPSAGD